MKKYLMFLFFIGISIETMAASKIGPEFRSGDFGPKCDCEDGMDGYKEYTSDGECVPTCKDPEYAKDNLQECCKEETYAEENQEKCCEFMGYTWNGSECVTETPV